MSKKRLLFVISLAVIVLSACVFSACTDSAEEVYLKEIEILTSHNGDYVLGETVDLSEITFKAVYSDGGERTLALTDEMLSEDDRNKFFTAGVHTVTVNYGGKQAVLQISVIDPGQEKVYTATFYSNGGSEVKPVTTAVITNFVPSVREGYTFDGWYATQDFSGSKAIAPYTLTQNTNFYAKWVDNRRCTVTFKDGEEVLYEFEVVYGTGIDITDLEKYPAPEDKEGLRFTGWQSSGARLDEITVDVVVEAVYETVQCTVIVYASDDAGLVQPYPRTVNYGTRFFLDGYTMPTQEGHTSRWVVYRNESITYEEWPEDSDFIEIKDERVEIRALHVINTYTVSIYNGKTQYQAVNEDLSDGIVSETNLPFYNDLKDGVVNTEKVYADSDKKTEFIVNFNNDFLISGFTQELYLKEPTAIYGYETVWCYEIETENGVILVNSQNKVWDSVTGTFVNRDGIEPSAVFDITDKDGNVKATVRNGDLNAIKGNVTVRAVYWKKEYKVRLMRSGSDSVWGLLQEFTLKYLEDFALYDPNYNSAAGDTWEEVRRYYLLHNVVSWWKEAGDEWTSIYFNGGNDDDWDIAWYTSPAFLPDSEVVFDNVQSMEITSDIALYCEDIDLRTYDVMVYYGYDFATGTYLKNAEFAGLTEEERFTLPGDATSNIVRTQTYNGQTYNMTYTFSGWYDFPYEPDGNGCKGTLYTSLDSRTRNMFYYAHYECKTTYTLSVYDKTQSVAYTDTILDGQHHDVQPNTVIYNLPAGTIFTLDMLYKGRTDGTTVFGQQMYEKAAFIENVYSVLTPQYQTLLKKYDPSGDYLTAVNNLNALIAEKQSVIDNFSLLLSKIYSYDYAWEDGEFTLEVFTANYLSWAEYHDIRRELQGLKNDLDVLETYADKLAEAQKYEQDDANYTDEGGLYKAYGDSFKYLNSAYGYDVEADPDKVKYRFAGWYLDENYSVPFDPNSKEMYFEWIATENITLYAKWADEEKGSEGLVFKKVTSSDGSMEALVVVDYMTASEYENSDIYGCGYNDFDNYDYSVNYNDQDAMPPTLGTDIDIQVPAYHGGTNAAGIPVIGILKDAFIRHGKDIDTVTLPDSLKFIEEGAFRNVFLDNIYSPENEYLAVQDDVAVYQQKDYASSSGEYSATAGTFILYAASSQGMTFTLPAGIVRIADYAFYGASHLIEVGLTDTLTSIGISAFEGCGSLVNTVSDTSFVLPEAVVSVGAYAFKDDIKITSVTTGSASALSYVGREAFSTTSWFASASRAGLVVFGGLCIGLREAAMADFDKDINGEYVVYEIDGLQRYGYTNDYGTLYYDNTTLVLSSIKFGAEVKGITDYALSGAASAVTKVEIEGELTKGLAEGAFNNCASLEEIYALNLAADSVMHEKAFTGTSRPTVYVSDGNIDASWLNSTYIDVVVVTP